MRTQIAALRGGKVALEDLDASGEFSLAVQLACRARSAESVIRQTEPAVAMSGLPGASAGAPFSPVSEFAP